MVPPSSRCKSKPGKQYPSFKPNEPRVENTARCTHGQEGRDEQAARRGVINHDLKNGRVCRIGEIEDGGRNVEVVTIGRYRWV
jgi:hypothetical protein